LNRGEDNLPDYRVHRSSLAEQKSSVVRDEKVSVELYESAGQWTTCLRMLNTA
jgi:hypothetical protein